MSVFYNDFSPMIFKVDPVKQPNSLGDLRVSITDNLYFYITAEEAISLSVALRGQALVAMQERVDGGA